MMMLRHRPPANVLKQALYDLNIPVGDRRTAIVRVLTEAGEHLTVAEIFSRAVARYAKISLVTVYRTMALFRDKGLFFAFDFGDGKTRYETALAGSHDHLINAEPGEISNFSDPRLDASLQTIAEERGLELRNHRVDILCARSGHKPSPLPRQLPFRLR